MKPISQYNKIKSYTTKDGSIIRELMHPDFNHNKNQSLAEAVIPSNTETLLHKHILSEEIYHIIQGQGLMTLGNEQFAVNRGDTICIPPNTPHKICNAGNSELIILCCCSPAYAHEDTQLI
ncbi:MAG: cupin domain-containing protein [Gammaproteobacteria bacterium]|nr:cupin domain-containing protein [Gammaproteobacteria bacterium]